MPDSLGINPRVTIQKTLTLLTFREADDLRFMSDTSEQMQDAARAVQSVLPPGTGFILLAFDFGLKPGVGRMDYVANGNREDCVAAMKEFIDKTEGKGRWAKHIDPNNLEGI